MGDAAARPASAAAAAAAATSTDGLKLCGRSERV